MKSQRLSVKSGFSPTIHMKTIKALKKVPITSLIMIQENELTLLSNISPAIIDFEPCVLSKFL